VVLLGNLVLEFNNCSGHHVALIYGYGNALNQDVEWSIRDLKINLAIYMQIP